MPNSPPPHTPTMTEVYLGRPPLVTLLGSLQPAFSRPASVVPPKLAWNSTCQGQHMTSRPQEDLCLGPLLASGGLPPGCPEGNLLALRLLLLSPGAPAGPLLREATVHRGAGGGRQGGGEGRTGLLDIRMILSPYGLSILVPNTLNYRCTGANALYFR